VKSGFVKSAGLNIYYEIEGEGQPLIILHGGPGIPHYYLQDLQALSPYSRLVFFDQRGTGKSEKADSRTYTIEANVEDTENLRAALGLGKCAVFGHSWGGILAQAYVLKYPENVTKLVLANTFSSASQLNNALQKMRSEVKEETRKIYERYEREGLYKGRDRYPDEYQKAVDMAYEKVSLNVHPPAYLQRAFQEMAMDVYRAMWGEETEFRITGTLRNFDFLPQLQEIRIPALVMVGTNDQTPIETAQETARRLPNSRLLLFERSRHYPFIEEKDKFVRVIREFLQE
jgi:proline iminopeptidase